MNERILKYAISLGDEWFAGFKSPVWQDVKDVVQRDKTSAKLLDERAVKTALQDLRKCGVAIADVYEVHMRKIGHARFD